MINKVQTIKTITKELIDYIKVKADVMVLEEGDSYKIEIISEEPSLIIGMKGQNLYALEHLVRLLVNKRIDEFAYLSLDICDYKKRRKSELENMVNKIVSKVKQDKKSHELESMNPADRKIIHTICQSVDGITSESIGFGNDRKVVIKIA